MRFNLKKLALLAAWTIFPEGSAYPQDAIDKLQPLVETSARRLAIAKQVALVKWDNGIPVEDASREEHVIASATEAGSRGAWIQHRRQTSLEHRSRPTSSFRTHCWQSGAGKARRRITRGSI